MPLELSVQYELSRLFYMTEKAEAESILQSVTGFFILMGYVEIPFTYTVRTIRNGKSYCIRAVDVTQDNGVCFTCTCSFKLEDWNPIELQEQVDLAQQYKSVLGGKRPEDHPESPGTEMPMFRNFNLRAPKTTPFPGLVTRKVDMKPYNEQRAPTERRQLTLYRPVGKMPPVSTAPNLHACAHLYASDRNSLFIIPKFWEINDNYTAMASLNHTVIFHGGEDLVDMQGGDEGPGGKWFCQEARTDRVADGRGVHHSRILDLEGRHIATTMQDGMIRLGFHEEEELEKLVKKYGTKSKI